MSSTVGKSSLGFLIEQNESPNVTKAMNTAPKEKSPSGASTISNKFVKKPNTDKIGPNLSKLIAKNQDKPAQSSLLENGKAKEANKASVRVAKTPNRPSFDNYMLRTQGEKTRNFLTDRPSTKVNSVPGGRSSLGYLFGDK